jgi:hypothetical protein
MKGLVSIFDITPQFRNNQPINVESAATRKQLGTFDPIASSK